MYKIDLLRQIEANTRGGAVSDCYSRYDLWRMIERNTRSKPNLPYQLDNGTWDMSHRELVKFSRSTKAWLDGKEYAPDEPRYTKGGELLIEGQATNFLPWNEVTFNNSKMTQLSETYCDYPIKRFEFTSNFSERSFILTGLELPVVTTYIVRSPFEDLAGILEVQFSGGEAGRKEVTLKKGELTKFSITNTTGSTPTRIWIKFKNFNGKTIDLMGLQVESGTSATSYTPTTNTAVTRAADIATVRDTQ